MTNYEDVLKRRAEQTTGFVFLDGWSSEHVTQGLTPREFFSGVYRPRGFTEVLVLHDIDSHGNELFARLHVYGRR